MLVPSRPARLWIDLFTYAAIDDASGALSLRAQQRERADGRCSPRPMSATWPIASRATWRARSCAGSGKRRRCSSRSAARSGTAPDPPPPGAGTGIVIAAFVDRPVDRRRGSVRGGVAHHCLKPQRSPEHPPLAFPDMRRRVRDGASHHLAAPAASRPCRCDIRCSARLGCGPRPPPTRRERRPRWRARSRCRSSRTVCS